MARRDVDALVLQMSVDLRRMERGLERAQAKTDQSTKAIERKWATSNSKIAASSAEALGGVQTGLTAIAGLLSGAAVIRYADAWTEARNKLAAAGVSATQLAGVQSELADLAIRTRSDLGATIDLYARLTRATEELGVGQREVFRATEILNKAFKASGASASESASAVTQLGQALGSGVLQGDELRSLRENSPALARAIAQEFGTTTAGLKKLGEEGKLVSDRVFAAILKAGKDIDAQYARTLPTMADLLGQVNTAATALVGTLAEIPASTNIVQGAASGITGILNRLTQAAREFNDSLPGVVGTRLIQDARKNIAATTVLIEDFSKASSEASRAAAGLDLILAPQSDAAVERNNRLQGLVSNREQMIARRTDVNRQIASELERLSALDADRTYLPLPGQYDAKNRITERVKLLDAEQYQLGVAIREVDRVLRQAAALPDAAFKNLAPPPETLERLAGYRTEQEKLAEALAVVAAAKASDFDKSRAALQALLDYATGFDSLREAIEAAKAVEYLSPEDLKIFLDQLYAVRLAADDAADALLRLPTDGELDDVTSPGADDRLDKLGQLPGVDESEDAMRQRMRDAVKDGLREGVTTGDWGDALRGVLADAVVEALNDSLDRLGDVIADLIFGTQQQQGLVDWALGLFKSGGGRANGGPVQPFSAVKVNEAGKGEFLYMGGRGGQVLTPEQMNRAIGGAGRGGAVTIDASVHVMGGIDAVTWPRVQQAMAQNNAEIIRRLPQAIDARVIDSQTRRRI